MTFTLAEAAVFLSGSLTVSILFKASLMLALGLVGASLAARSPAAMRHMILAATFGVLIFWPFLSAGGPRFLIEIPLSGASEPLAPGAALPSSPDVAPFAPSNAGPFGGDGAGSTSRRSAGRDPTESGCVV